MQSIYIILSQSGTDISKLLKFVTREKYNHASICITDDFTKFYSFGRKKINNPLIGGFLIENAFEHVFGKFNYVPCLILELKINDDQYIKIESLINDFIKKSDSLSYDFLALFLAKTPLSITNDSKYFCSQFVAKILNDIGISTPKKPEHMHPMDFTLLDDIKVIYEGDLKRFCTSLLCNTQKSVS